MRKAALLLALALATLCVLGAGVLWREGYLGKRDQPTKRDIAEFMASRYGDYDSKEQAWREDAKGAVLLFSPCAQQRVGIEGARHILLAACGRNRSNSHVDSGRADFYLLEKTPSALVVAASAEGEMTGSWGDPGTVTIVQLGKGFYGFQLEVSDMHFGRSYTQLSLHAPRNSRIVPVLKLQSFADSNPCTATPELSAGKACTDVRRSLLVDTRQPELPAYPIVVKERGHYDGDKLLNHDYPLHFDSKHWRYPLPKLREFSD